MKIRHGSPYDRGSADRYYGRPYEPHYFKGATYQSEKVTDLSEAELAEYDQGYYEQQDQKDFN